MSRIIFARLARDGERMPDPFNPQIDFPAEGKRIDAEDPVWMALLADGSLTEVKVAPELSAPPLSSSPSGRANDLARPGGPSLAGTPNKRKEH